MVRVSSPRSNFASVKAAAFHARMALTAGWSGMPSSTGPFPMSGIGWLMLKVRLVLAPVEDAFAHDVIKADGDEAEVDNHLPEAEELRTAGELRKLAVDHGPGHH